jgi:glycosyltransferase involved in cell wall biosynthesis
VAQRGLGLKLSILVPVFNERSRVEELVQRVLHAPLPPGWMREVLLIDDGSTDGTSELLDALAQGDLVRVHHSPVNCGKGTSVRIGLKLATGEYTLIQDADLEYDPQDYPLLLEPLRTGRADVVYGSRFLGSRQGMSFSHVLGNRLLTWTANRLFGGRLTDAYTCYKAMPLLLARSLDLRARDFDLEAEITARVLSRRLRIQEVPIRYRARSGREGKKIRKMDGLLGWLALLRYRFLS